MRKHIAVIIILSILSFVFSSCKINSGQTTETVIPNTAENEFIKAVWLNYNELAMKNEPDKSEKAFREKVSVIVNNCSEYGFNRIIVQVRPFCDAFYNSSVFPASAYLSGIQGEYIGYDALSIVIEYAKKKNIKIDAWINPFRVAYDTDTAKPDPAIYSLALKKFGIDIKDAWYIGDTYLNDIEASKKAGWHAVWFNRRNNPLPANGPKPEYEVFTEEEMTKLVLELVSSD